MCTRRAFIVGMGSAGLRAALPPARGVDWPQCRGPDRNGISKETGLLRKWPAAGPRLLWAVPVAEGYAGAAIVGGRVYHHDYDERKSEWSINCRSLDGGKAIWQFREPREIRPNHAITRTIPAVDGRFVCSLDPKAVLHCLDAKTGKEVWRKSLVTEYQATIPSWYNGQCPFQEPGRIIIATGRIELNHRLRQIEIDATSAVTFCIQLQCQFVHSLKTGYKFLKLRAHRPVRIRRCIRPAIQDRLQIRIRHPPRAANHPLAHLVPHHLAAPVGVHQ